MSGSPPPETPREPSQLAGHRRKRSDTPPDTTASSVSTFPSIARQTPYPYGELQPERREEGSMQVATQPIPFLPPLSYGAGPGIPVAQYSPQDIAVAQPQISPRSTRKTKAHVASACINCKKKHLRCDSSRPCRRCVQGGKEDTCKDVEHKKRGRPPLKPEDPSSMGRTRGRGTSVSSPFSDPSSSHFGSESRGFGPSVYPPILPNAQPSMYGHNRTSSRTSIYSGLQSPYAQASIAPSPMTAMGSGFTYSGRPPSTSSTLSAQAPSPYTMQAQQISQEHYPRQPQFYGGGFAYPGFPSEMPTNTQPFYPNPIFHREQQLPISQGESQIGPYGNTGLQLPPIRPATQATNLGPAFSPQQRRTHPPPPPQQQQQQRQQQQPPPPPLGVGPPSDESRERDPKRPKMDIQGILGPKND